MKIKYPLPQGEREIIIPSLDGRGQGGGWQVDIDCEILYITVQFRRHD